MKVSERSYSFIYKYVDMSLSKMIRETSSYIFFFYSEDMLKRYINSNTNN